MSNIKIDVRERRPQPRRCHAGPPPPSPLPCPVKLDVTRLMTAMPRRHPRSPPSPHATITATHRRRRPPLPPHADNTRRCPSTSVASCSRRSRRCRCTTRPSKPSRRRRRHAATRAAGRCSTRPPTNHRRAPVARISHRHGPPLSLHRRRFRRHCSPPPSVQDVQPDGRALLQRLRQDGTHAMLPCRCP